jgi:hypothetical protein
LERFHHVWHVFERMIEHDEMELSRHIVSVAMKKSPLVAKWRYPLVAR